MVDEFEFTNMSQKITKNTDGTLKRVHTEVSGLSSSERKGKQMFYLTTHSTHFIYGYMASDIW